MIHHCTFSHHKITFKGKKSEKVAIVKAHIGSFLYNSMERQKLRQPPSTMLQQQVILSLSEVETESQSDRSSCRRSFSKSSPQTNFIPEPCAETLGTFSIRFFMGNGKPQTAKCHVTTVLRSRLQFAVQV